MLHLFDWLDLHPGFYWALAVLASLALLTGTLARLRRPAGTTDHPAWGWVFAGLTFACLLAWRWPFLFSSAEYNPDESQFVAGALTLARDPVFWRSVDGTTSGPLNFYILLPWSWLGLPLDYFAVRFVGLLLLTVMVGGLRRFSAALAPATAALAVAPVALLLATLLEPDFVHYSSELLPLALLGLAAGCLARRPLVAAGLAGLLPWAKLQALLLAGVLVGWLLLQAWRDAPDIRTRARRLGALLAAAVAPSLLALALVAAAGEFPAFWHRYVLQNILYAGTGGSVPAVLRNLTHQASESGLFPVWTGASLLLVVVSAGLYAAHRRAPSRHFWLGAALTAAAAVSILLPARPSLHYVLFLAAPLALWTGAILGDFAAAPGRRLLVALTLAAAVAPLAVRLRQPAPAMVGALADHWRQPRPPVAEVLRHWRPAGARLAVWGWANSLYAESGLRQGVRDMLTIWSMQPSPQQDYYRRTLLADFRTNRPELFVDAVGPGAPFFQDRAMLGHETFPELAAIVRADYLLVTELGPDRVYVRRDFLAAHPLSAVELRRRAGRGRLVYDEPRRPDAVVPASAPWTKVDGASYQMIEPPTELHWRLAGDERDVLVRFGFEPRAYLEGRTDGAEFLVELRPPGRPPLTVGHRRLDPLHQPGDRGPLALRATLPPYPAGTELVVRATPGKDGNAAWDWLYFDQLQFVRSPYFTPRQFPRFSRIPDQVQASYPQLLDRSGEWLLMLPPPAALTFTLLGNEQQLNFSYGLQEEAYTGSGRTDGVLYQVNLLRDGEAPRRLFDRWLEPLERAGDRGRQYADLHLPAGLRPGDRLELRIEAGANDSWDWAYLASLDLR